MSINFYSSKFLNCFLWVLFSSSLAGQSYNSVLLKKMAGISADTFSIRKVRALEMAKRMNLQSLITDKEETTFELISFQKFRPTYLVTHNAGGASLIKTSEVYSGGGAGYHLSGTGSILGIWDAGRVRQEHQEFGSRITQVDNASTNHNHATHVAGTMIAEGESTLAKGMSYNATLWAHDWNNDTGEMANAAVNGLEVSQHSYGYLTGWHYGSWSGTAAWHWFGDANVAVSEDYAFGHYGETAREWDILAYNAPDYLISASAGNDRGQGPDPGASHYFWDGSNWTQSSQTRIRDGGSNGFDCISHRALGKNVMTIGAVDGVGNMTGFSSWGPTDDGRVKPDVVAKGLNVTSTGANSNTHYFASGGTSMSGPMVSGSLGIVMEHQENLHAGQKLTSAMKKALIIHTANDEIDGVPGPDYRFGWGLMNTRKAVEFMTRNANLGQGVIMMESSLFPNDTINLVVQSTGAEPLRASLVWTDLPGDAQAPALNSTVSSLVNDLDMRLIGPANSVFFPYVLNPVLPLSLPTTGDNMSDNVEMIHLASTNANDTYTIKIHHKSMMANHQKFAVIISGANVNDCPILAIAPGKAIINNSYFDLACNLDNGHFLPPTGSACPVGSTIQYRVDNGSWSSTLPAYNQTGPIQSIFTRCVCNTSPDYTSPESRAHMTKPNSVNSSSNSGIGSLSLAIQCAIEFDTIYFDHFAVDSVMITSFLNVNKCLTIQGNSSLDKSKILFDYNAIGTNAGLQLSGTSKELILSNLVLEAINNTAQTPLINIQTGNQLILLDEVKLND